MLPPKPASIYSGKRTSICSGLTRCSTAMRGRKEIVDGEANFAKRVAEERAKRGK
jgi:hypothetical protein